MPIDKMAIFCFADDSHIRLFCILLDWWFAVCVCIWCVLDHYQCMHSSMHWNTVVDVVCVAWGKQFFEFKNTFQLMLLYMSMSIEHPCDVCCDDAVLCTSNNKMFNHWRNFVLGVKLVIHHIWIYLSYSVYERIDQSSIRIISLVYYFIYMYIILS